jgi:hypothetical protein
MRQQWRAAVSLTRALKGGIRTVLPQPAVSAATASLAALALLALWSDVPSASALLPRTWPALALAGVVVLTYQFPIHAKHQTKIYLFTAVYYLLAVLVPPPLAASAAGLGPA